jgi:selenoprotein W-related protein
MKEARLKSEVTIEYCTVWNYEPKAASLAARIRKTAGVPPRLIASGGGAFEIRVNGELIYSKLETGEWPDFDAIAEQVKSKIWRADFAESEGCLVALAVFKTVVGPVCAGSG